MAGKDSGHDARPSLPSRPGPPWKPAPWQRVLPYPAALGVRTRVPGRSRLAVPELEPADGVREPDRPHRTGRGAIGREHGPADVERLAPEGGGQRTPRADRRELTADRLDLPPEGRTRPMRHRPWRCRGASQELEGVQRQRPSGRRRWCGSGSVARWEESHGRLEGHADRWLVAATRPSRRIGDGRTSDDRHARIVGGEPSTRAYPPVNVRPSLGRRPTPVGGTRSPRRGPCG